MRVLFVGINPGIRSSMTGHHFAGASNRFWKLLFDSGLVPERLSFDRDAELAGWGFGLTNLVAKPTRGIGELAREDYEAGRAALGRKVRRFRPEVVALVGVTLHRALFGARVVALGLQPERWAGARVFLLPNPSGRNANYTYEEMRTAFAGLRAWLDGGDGQPSSTGSARPTRRPTRRR